MNCQNAPLCTVGIHAITYEYTWWMDPKDQGVMIDAIDKMVGDYQFTCPVQEFAQRYADTFNDVSVNLSSFKPNYFEKAMLFVMSNCPNWPVVLSRLVPCI